MSKAAFYHLQQKTPKVRVYRSRRCETALTEVRFTPQRAPARNRPRSLQVRNIILGKRREFK